MHIIPQLVTWEINNGINQKSHESTYLCTQTAVTAFFKTRLERLEVSRVRATWPCALHVHHLEFVIFERPSGVRGSMSRRSRAHWLVHDRLGKVFMKAAVNLFVDLGDEHESKCQAINGTTMERTSPAIVFPTANIGPTSPSWMIM